MLIDAARNSVRWNSTGEPFKDYAGNLQIVLFQHDHVPVAVVPVIAEAQGSDLYPSLRQILRGTVIVNRTIGSLSCDDESRDIGEIGKMPRRRLLLPAANEIRSIRLCLLFDFQLRGIVYRRIVGDRDVGNPPSPRLVRTEHGILERRSRRLDRDHRLDQLRSRIGDQPAEWPGLRMGQDDIAPAISAMRLVKVSDLHKR